MTDSKSLGHGMKNEFDFLISMPMRLPRMQVDSSMLAGGPLDLRSGAERWDTMKHPAMKLLFSHGSHGICLVCDQWMCTSRVRRLLRIWIVNSASCCQSGWLVWNHSPSNGLLVLAEPPFLTDCVYNHGCWILCICWRRLSGIGMSMMYVLPLYGIFWLVYSGHGWNRTAAAVFYPLCFQRLAANAIQSRQYLL